jgi:arylsulfatase A-like enzyme
MSPRAQSKKPNILFITLDQFRGDSMSCAGHPLVKTPNLDRLAAAGVRFARHYAQAAPCAPGRAALYTGMYQMNNRVVANGTPLDDRFDNIARAAGRAGYEPTLFGYTDQSIDPRTVTDPNDPRLRTYEGILPGFTSALDLTGNQQPWVDWLNGLGYDVTDGYAALATEHKRPSGHSESAFVTDHFLEWIERHDEPWFAHASYLRPHPPYRAAGEYATLYDPLDCPDPLPQLRDGTRHPLHDALLAVAESSAIALKRSVAEVRAQYYGMISEVDANLGRIWDALVTRGEWENTVIVVTADHGEQLGDQGLIGKAGFFESSYHILGIVRDPSSPEGHGTVVNKFTENVDIFPTLCEAMGIAVPLQCDGLPLTPYLQGTEPPHWRTAATYEWDWRDTFLRGPKRDWPWDQRLERQHLTVQRSDTHAYVQFGDGSFRSFALAMDPTWRTEELDASVVLHQAQAMLVWRSRHTERTLTGVLHG